MHSCRKIRISSGTSVSPFPGSKTKKFPLQNSIGENTGAVSQGELLLIEFYFS